MNNTTETTLRLMELVREQRDKERDKAKEPLKVKLYIKIMEQKAPAMGNHRGFRFIAKSGPHRSSPIVTQSFGSALGEEAFLRMLRLDYHMTSYEYID